MRSRATCRSRASPTRQAARCPRSPRAAARRAPGVSWPGSSRQRQLPNGSPGRFIRPSLPRPSTSWAGIIASAAREESAYSISCHGSSSGQCSRSVVRVVRRRVDDLALAVVLERGAGCPAGSWKAQRRTAMPGKPSVSRSSSTSGVIRPRSSAITGSSPSSRRGGAEERLARAGQPVTGARVELVRALRDRPEGGEAAEVVDADEVVEREHAAQPLDPPAVALARDRVPVEERIAPVLSHRPELVRRRARDDAVEEELGMGAVVDAPLRDVDRDVADHADAALAGVRAQRRPLALEPDLVGDRAAEARPVLDPVGVRAAEGGPLARRDRRARVGEQALPGRERRRRPRTASRGRRAG